MIEDLTDAIYGKADEIMKETDEIGGWREAIKHGWVDSHLDEGAYRYQREIENRERIVVGVNVFQSPPEEDIVPGGCTGYGHPSKRKQSLV